MLEHRGRGRASAPVPAEHGVDEDPSDRAEELAVVGEPGAQLEGNGEDELAKRDSVFDRAFRRDGDRLVVPIGDFNAKDQKSVLVKVRLPKGAPGLRALGDVRLAFQDLVEERPGECAGTLAVTLTESADQASPLDSLVEARLARSETAEAILSANELWVAGDADGATRALERQEQSLRSRQLASTSNAPAARSGSVKDDFTGQSAALEKAKGGFDVAKPKPASPGAPAPMPTESREGKAAPKRNVDLAEPFLR